MVSADPNAGSDQEGLVRAGEVRQCGIRQGQYGDSARGSDAGSRLRGSRGHQPQLLVRIVSDCRHRSSHSQIRSVPVSDSILVQSGCVGEDKGPTNSAKVDAGTGGSTGREFDSSAIPLPAGTPP